MASSSKPEPNRPHRQYARDTRAEQARSQRQQHSDFLHHEADQTPMSTPVVFARLNLGQPNSPAEKEADAVADKLTTPQSTGPVMTGNGGPPPPDIQPSADTGNDAGGTSVSNQMGSALHQSAGKGASLPNDKSEGWGQRMGSDLSKVKVHTDDQADAMSRSIGAKAFTYGQDIYFKKGEYQPGTKAGDHLLAHETAHTVQQGKHGGQIQRTLDYRGAEDDADDLQGTLILLDVFSQEGKLFEILIRYRNEPEKIEELKKAYKNLTGKDLISTLKKQLEGGMQDIVLSILGENQETNPIPPTPTKDEEYEAIADKIHGWVVQYDGAETEERTKFPVEQLFAVLMPLNREKAKIDKLEEVYNKKYAGDVGFTFEIDIYFLAAFTDGLNSSSAGVMDLLTRPKDEPLNFNKVIRQLKRKSPTAKAIITDLERSPHRHTVEFDAKSNNVLGAPKPEGDGTTIQFNFSIKSLEGQSLEGLEDSKMFLIMGHEFAHAWRYDRGIAIPVADRPKEPEKKKSPFGLDLSFDSEFTKPLGYRLGMKRYYETLNDHNLTEEVEASHVENMIRAELSTKKNRIPLREKYSGIQQVNYNHTLNYKTTEKVSPDVAKENFDYYRDDPDKEWQSIHEQYGLDPREKAKKEKKEKSN